MNQEHYDILIKGVKTWNKWRKDNPEIVPNLSFAKLPGYNLPGVNLSGVNLGRANLRETNLSGADLRGANLYAAYLSNCKLCNAVMDGAKFQGCDVGHPELEIVTLRWDEVK